MSVLDNFDNYQHATLTPERDDYQFEDGDLNFIAELNQPKQEMNIEERPDFETSTPQDGDLLDNLPDDQQDELIAAAVDETATLITDTIDSGAAFGLSLISKNDIDSHRATADQKSRMRKIIYVYCEKTGGYIPLWLQLIILIVGIYGVQIPGALHQRKINELEEKVRLQQEKLHAYELEQQARDIQKQLNDKQAGKEVEKHDGE